MKARNFKLAILALVFVALVLAVVLPSVTLKASSVVNATSTTSSNMPLALKQPQQKPCHFVHILIAPGEGLGYREVNECEQTNPLLID